MYEQWLWSLAAVIGPLVLAASLTYTKTQMRAQQRTSSKLNMGSEDSNLAPKHPCEQNRSQYRDSMQHGYDRWSKENEPFFLLNWPRDRDWMLPVSLVPWLVTQADNQLSISENLEDIFAVKYTLPYVQNPTHEAIIRRSLTRNLDDIVPDIAEEIDLAIRDFWSDSEEVWHNVPVLDTVLKTVARISSRAFVGAPLCRNLEYNQQILKYVQALNFVGLFINLIPRFLRPLLAPPISLVVKFYYRRCMSFILPLAKQRMQMMSLPAHQRPEMPNDFITWAAEDVAGESSTFEEKSNLISFRITNITFPAVHTTTFTTTNVLFDLISAPPEKGFIREIREEVNAVLREEHGVWTKSGLSRMIKLDSAIRESMRYSGMFSRMLVRKIVVKEGIELDGGVHVPYGQNVGVPAFAIHHDANLYEHPYEYDAFRFSRAREEIQSRRRDDLGDDKALDLSKRLSMPNTSETWLPFGHGRHACPGRYFATDEMKILIGQILVRHDIETLVERPANTWFMDTILPPKHATIRLKRHR